jgi:hypothetical protein
MTEISKSGLTSPLYPLKGRIASILIQNKFGANTPPTGGQGVNRNYSKIFI